MKFQMVVRAARLCFVVAGLVTTSVGQAQDSLLGKIERLASPSTMAVARIRLDAYDLKAWRNRLDPDTAALSAAQVAQKNPTLALLNDLKRYGATEAFLFFQIGSFDREVAQVAALFEEVPDEEALNALKRALHAYTAFTDYRSDGTLLVMTRGVEETPGEELRLARPEIRSALAQHPDSVAVFALALSDAQRQALRIADPALPPQFGDRTLAELAGDLAWLSVGLTVNADVTVAVEVQARNDASAQRLQVWARALATRAAQATRRAEIDPGARLLSAMRVVPGSNASFQLEFQDQASRSDSLNWLGRQLADIVFPRLVDGSIKQSLQVGLALINYEATNGHYPLAGSIGDAGQPLLSWRVHLLPYLEESELYRQFRLDEPWDSEHNRTLIAKMPAIFMSPASKLELSAGRSNLIAPVGERYIVGINEPRRIRDVIDGTSRTIAILEVDDTAAEIWTKPPTSETDATELLKHLGKLHRNRFVVSLGDGHTLTLRNDTPAKILHKLMRVNSLHDDPDLNEYELREEYRAR